MASEPLVGDRRQRWKPAPCVSAEQARVRSVSLDNRGCYRVAIMNTPWRALDTQAASASRVPGSQAWLDTTARACLESRVDEPIVAFGPCYWSPATRPRRHCPRSPDR